MGKQVVKVKVVPGASRDAVVGPLGDALKVRVSAPPEGGKANEAVARLLAAHFGVARKQVRIVAGRSAVLKSVEIDHSPAGRMPWRTRGRKA